MTQLQATRAQVTLTATQLASLHLTPVELVAAPVSDESLVPVAATLKLRGSSPGGVAGYGDRENIALGWLDSYESGGATVTHRPQWGRTTLDALIRAARDDADGPPFAILMENRFLWQAGVRPGKALGLWLTEILAPVNADNALDAEVYYLTV